MFSASDKNPQNLRFLVSGLSMAAITGIPPSVILTYIYFHLHFRSNLVDNTTEIYVIKNLLDILKGH